MSIRHRACHEKLAAIEQISNERPEFFFLPIERRQHDVVFNTVLLVLPARIIEQNASHTCSSTIPSRAFLHAQLFDS